MKKFQIYIKDKNYTDWEFKDINNENIVDINKYPILQKVNPLEQKYFSRDILIVDENNNLVLERSILKNSNTIAGVLVLEGNKTYGRKKKRLLYKCIPDDKYLPAFLVPYDIKMGFQKKLINKYVVFKFQSWDDKHPHGSLIETLGDVNNLEVFYEYQLYCKSLYISISEFSENTKKALNMSPHDVFIEQIMTNENYDIEDRTGRRIISIDPEKSTDFDDAFGIEQKYEDGVQTGWIVSIYIANVYLWLETLDLWKTFSHRVATIYLPDRKRPMLPTILSDTLCSLQENQKRFACTLDVEFDMDANIILDSLVYKNTLISVHKNYRYEREDLLFKEPVYIKLFDLSCKMDRNIRTSHDIVSHWMIFMNAYSGIQMISNKIGIFRSVIFNKENNNDELLSGLEISDNAKTVIKNWNNVSGHYINYDNDAKIDHQLLSDSFCYLKAFQYKKLKPYIHITSPIRRLVDLLNQIILMRKFKLVKDIGNNAGIFLNEWILRLDYINTSMRSIKKIQTDCQLLFNCTKNPEYLENVYSAVVFDKIKRTSGSFNYNVFIEKLNIISRITTHVDLNEYEKCNVKLFMFETEDNVKKKVKLQIVL